MPRGSRSALVTIAVVSLAGSGVFEARPAGDVAMSQAASQPTNDAPNPYQTIENHFKLPDGRTWGSTSAVDIAPDGTTIWVAERCGANSCWDAKAGRMSDADVVLKFDRSGKLLASFAPGLMVFPHGIHVDRGGNVWVTDGQDNLPRRPAGAPADAPLPAPPAKVVGHQVFKFSPDGKLLLTLGKAGGNQPGQKGDPSSFYQPNDVITLPNGDILVAEGHSNAENISNRIVRSAATASTWANSASADRDRWSSFSRTRSRSIRRDASSSAIAATTGSRS